MHQTSGLPPLGREPVHGSFGAGPIATKELFNQSLIPPPVTSFHQIMSYMRLVCDAQKVWDHCTKQLEIGIGRF